MRLSRQSRFAAALLTLFCVLFTQLAVAAYACPSMQIGQAMATMDTMEAAAFDARAMVECEGMDAEAPVLCPNQGQVANQSLDKPQLPNILPFMPSLLVQTVSHADIASQPKTVQLSSRVLTRSTAPPLSIQNCCFRI